MALSIIRPASTFQLSDLQAILAAQLATVKLAGEHAIVMQQHEHDCRILALTMVGEGRGESLDGRVAIGWTVRNRADTKGKTITERCLQRLQYSTWWVQGGANNYRALMNLAEVVFGATTTPAVSSWAAAYWESLVLAGGVLDGRLRDRTSGATHYLTTQLLNTSPPAWARGHTPTVAIDHHSFFAGIPWS